MGIMYKYKYVEEIYIGEWRRYIKQMYALLLHWMDSRVALFPVKYVEHVTNYESRSNKQIANISIFMLWSVKVPSTSNYFFLWRFLFETWSTRRPLWQYRKRVVRPPLPANLHSLSHTHKHPHCHTLHFFDKINRLMKIDKEESGEEGGFHA